jgi:hypothetical protein
MPHKRLRLKRLLSRRMAASLTFAVLFFAGAAFTAGAGDLVSDATEATPEAAAPATVPEAPAAAPEAPAAAESGDPECTTHMKDFDREEC